MDPIAIAGIIGIGLAVLLISVAGPGGYFIVFSVLKVILGYGWKLMYPLWIVAKQKGPYKAAAVGLAFTNFWVYLYSFLQTGDSGALNAAINALAATLAGGFNQITTAGYIMLSNPTDPMKILGGIAMMILGLSSIMLWFIGWRMLKRRVPELTYYILVFALMITLAWGINELGAIFEITELAKTAAETTGNNTTVNATEKVGGESVNTFSLLSD